jgi:hypothetical protein
MSLRSALADLPGPSNATAGVVSGNPVIRAVEGALRALGAETRETAEALLDAAPAELTDRERKAILARFTSATEYRRDSPSVGAPLPPDVGGYPLGGKRWPNLNRPT